MSWSAFQREMMAAMDLRPYRLATTPAAETGHAADAADARADARAEARADARAASPAQAPRDTAAQRAQAAVSADARRGGAVGRDRQPLEQPHFERPDTARPRVDPPHVDPPRVDPLIAALLRAAGREIDTPTLLAWADGLRGNARAKRALWPRLRALRRSGA
jgi:hypothetical protein